MKIDGSDHSEPAKPSPTPGQFQLALQRAGAQSSSRLPANPSPSRPAIPGRPMPRFPPHAPGAAPPPTSTARPPASAAPSPMGTARLPGTALAPGAVVALSRSALASPENLGQARQTMHGEALRLRATRTEAQTMAQKKTEHRLSELISRELSREFHGESLPFLPSRATPVPPEPSRGPALTEGLAAAGEPRPAIHLAGMASPEAPDTQAKVQATLQLIEKIELLVQSQRPALRMSLGAPLSAMVEVERTAPREVALRIQGRLGPLAQEDLARIRDALEARGLRLRSLHSE
jgi:hypothetical protein